MYEYFFKPNLLHKVIIFSLLPVSAIYYALAVYKKRRRKEVDLGIKIVSVGNIVSGGSGKTPFCISLIKELESKQYSGVFTVLRGYGRESKGIKLVSHNGKIVSDVKTSGDEAMLIASNTKASVIVSEDRIAGINMAKEMGARVIIMDDGYRFNFKKFDILLRPKQEPHYNLVLPSGYYRFPKRYYKKCDLSLEEDKHYHRESRIIGHTERMLLITAIANPQRLNAFLEKYECNIIGKIYLRDHAKFVARKIKKRYEKHNASSILVTQKDYVKCRHFDLKFSILDMRLVIEKEVIDRVCGYLDS